MNLRFTVSTVSSHVCRLPGPVTIEVTLFEARNLKAADWNGTSDPYVSVKYGNLKQRSKVIYKTLTPQWNQTLEFKESEARHLALHVKVRMNDSPFPPFWSLRSTILPLGKLLAA